MPGLHLGLGLGLQRQVKRASGPAPDPLAISGTPVTTATEGTAYTGFTVSASGGTAPYTYSLVGTWPAGISIDPSTGAVSGTPTENGSFAGLSVRVTDAASATDDLDAFSLDVEAAAPSDPYWANVVLLCGFDGVDGAATSSDESSKGHALTFNGNAQLDTAQSKFGGASALFDGTGDYITTPNSADWNISTANSDQFTIEFWIRPGGTALSSLGIVRKDGSAGNFGWTVQTSDLRPSFKYSTDGNGGGSLVTIQNGSGAKLSQSAFSHIAIDKDTTGKIRMYVNGGLYASATPANSVIFNSTAALEIGQASVGMMIGNLDEIRITKGVARYASDAGFTVPTAAFPRG